MADLPEVVAYQARVAESEQRVSSLQAQLSERDQALSNEQSNLSLSIRNINFRRGAPARPTVQKVQQLTNQFNLERAGFEQFQTEAQATIAQENTEVQAAYEAAQAAQEAENRRQADLAERYQSGNLTQGEFTELFQDQFANNPQGNISNLIAISYYNYLLSHGQNLTSEQQYDLALSQREVRSQFEDDKVKPKLKPLEQKLDKFVVGNEAVTGGYSSVTGESVFTTASGKKIVQSPVSMEVKKDNFSKDVRVEYDIKGFKDALPTSFVVGEFQGASFVDYKPKQLVLPERPELPPVTLNLPASLERVGPREFQQATAFTKADAQVRSEEAFLRATGFARPIFEVGGKIEEAIGEVGAFQGRTTFNLFVKPLSKIYDVKTKGTPRANTAESEFFRELGSERSRIVFTESGRAFTEVGSFFIPGGKAYAIGRAGVAVLSSRSTLELEENLATSLGFLAVTKGIGFATDLFKLKKAAKIVSATERVLDVGYLGLSTVELGTAIAYAEEPYIKENIKRKAVSYGTIRLGTGIFNYGLARAKTGLIEFSAERNLPRLQKFLLAGKLPPHLPSQVSSGEQLQAVAKKTSPRYQRELIILEKQVKGLKGIVPKAKQIDISLVESVRRNPKTEKALLEFYRKYGDVVVTGGSIVPASNIKSPLSKRPADIDIYVPDKARKSIIAAFKAIAKEEGTGLVERKGVFYARGGREKVIEFPSLEKIGFSNIKTTLGPGESVQSRIQTVEVVESTFKGKGGGTITDPLQSYLAKQVIKSKGYIAGSGALTIGVKGFRQPADIEGYFEGASSEKLQKISEGLAQKLSTKFGEKFTVSQVSSKFFNIVNPKGQPVADLLARPVGRDTIVKVGQYEIRSPEQVYSDKRNILRYGVLEQYLQPKIAKNLEDVKSIQELTTVKSGVEARVIDPYTLLVRNVYGGLETAKGKTVYRYSKDIPRFIQSLSDIAVQEKVSPSTNIPVLKQLNVYKSSRFLEFVKTNYSDALTRSKVTPIPNRPIQVPGLFNLSYFQGFNVQAPSLQFNQKFVQTPGKVPAPTDNRFQLNVLGRVETKVGFILPGTKVKSILTVGEGSQPVQDIAKLTGKPASQVLSEIRELPVQGFKPTKDILSTDYGSFQPGLQPGQQSVVRIATGLSPTKTAGVIAHEVTHAEDFLTNRTQYVESQVNRRVPLLEYYNNPFEARASAVEGRYLQTRGETPIVYGKTVQAVAIGLGDVPISQIPNDQKEFGLTVRGVIQTNLGFYPTRTKVGDILKIGEQSQVVQDISTITGEPPKKLVAQLKGLDVQVLSGKDASGKPFPKELISGIGIDTKLPGTETFEGKTGALGIAIRRFQGITPAEGAFAHEFTHAGEFFAGAPQDTSKLSDLAYSLSGSEVRARSVQQRFLSSKGSSLPIGDLLIIGTNPEIKPLNQYSDYGQKPSTKNIDAIYAQAYRTTKQSKGLNDSGTLGYSARRFQSTVENYREGPSVGTLNFYKPSTVAFQGYNAPAITIPKGQTYTPTLFTTYTPQEYVPATPAEYVPPNIYEPIFPGYNPGNVASPSPYSIGPYGPYEAPTFAPNRAPTVTFANYLSDLEKKKPFEEKKKAKIKTKKVPRGFDVFVLRNIKGKKQFLEVDDKGTSLLFQDAQKFGQNVTDLSLEASYFVKESKSPVAQLKGLPDLSYKFRLSKERIRKTIPVYVEIESYRLDTPSEVKKIHAARVAAQLRKNIIITGNPNRAKARIVRNNGFNVI